MGRYGELITIAMQKGNEQDSWQVAEEMMDKLHRRDPDLYDETIERLERIAYRISRNEAEQIVRNMRPKGQYWSYSQVEDLLRSKGITSDVVNWYLVMNMVYNDYCGTAKAFGLQNDVNFFFHLAQDFIEDPDAKPMKVERYFQD